MSLSYAMLGLLSYGPMTGYTLKKIFDKSISQVWAASLSQIYRELGKLEKKGWVSSNIQKQEDRPDKRIYEITDEGKTAFLTWLDHFPEKLMAPKRDEFMLRIFFGAQMDKKGIIIEFKRFISQNKDYLKMLTEIESNFDIHNTGFSLESPEKEELFWHLTIKRAKMTLNTVIKWAEESIEEIEGYDYS